MSEVKVRANALLNETIGPSLEQVGTTLRDLGLGGYAVSAFTALLRLPRATAGELVRRTGVPDSKIYYALDELAEKGLVEVQAGKPKIYRVVPVREVRLRLAKIVEDEYERRRAATSRLISLMEPLRAASVSPSTDVAFIVKGLPNVLSRLDQLVASARKDLLLLVAEESVLRRLEEPLLKAVRRGVHVRLAIPDVAMRKDLEKAVEVRSIVCDCVLLVADRQQVLSMTRTSKEDAYAITSTDGTLVRLGLEYWESPRCCVSCP